MEIASNEFEIISNEIAKLKQAEAEFDLNFVPIDLYSNLTVNQAETNGDATENSDFNIEALMQTLEPKIDHNKDDEYDTGTSVDPLALALALNRKNQKKMSSLLSVIKLALEQNKLKIAELRKSINEAEEDAPTNRRRNMSLFGKPYFKDFEGSFPKPNPDTIAKKELQEIDAFTRPSKPWTIEDNDILLESVKNDFLQRKLRPLMSRKQIELAKYSNAVDGTEERMELEGVLNNIDQMINAIKVSSKQDYGCLKEIHEVDWLKIANVDLKEQRSSESCRNFWGNVAHPSINKLPWTAEEERRLVELAKQFKERRWEKIANLLGTGRSAFFCLLRYQTKFNPILQSKWTLMDDRKLEKHIKTHTNKDGVICWSKVSKLLQSKSTLECKHRWNKIKGKLLNKTKWDKHLDRKLSQAVKVFGHNWMKVSRYVPGKDSAQCRDRYTNTLDESLKLGFWTHEEDTILWKAVKIHKLDGQWARISQEFLPHRTDNQILIRYRRLLVYEEKAIRKIENTNNVIEASGQEADPSQNIEAPRRPITRIYDRTRNVDNKCDLAQPSNETQPPVISYSLRKRSHEVRYVVIEDGDDRASESEDEVCSAPKKIRLEGHDDGCDESNTRATEASTAVVAAEVNTAAPAASKTLSARPKQRVKNSSANVEIKEVLCEFYRKQKKFGKYKAKQESKPGFSKAVEKKFMNLLGNALKIPIPDHSVTKQINIPLLPPNRTSISAFKYLMDSRKDLVNSAQIFQFPKNIKLPKPWERCQAERFVDTSRTFGNKFLQDLVVNPNFTGDLKFNKELMTAEDEPIIEHMRQVLLSTKKDFPREMFTKHNQASKHYRLIKSSEEYQSLQLKFRSLFFWPLLLNYSSKD